MTAYQNRGTLIRLQTVVQTVKARFPTASALGLRVSVVEHGNGWDEEGRVWSMYGTTSVLR